ncbi:hypothetical protein [Sphingomonas humi]|uniref:Uncharacterized protein n=1 Tax=Sphingomonas humi TaxID=335630 RepID=A0ABP7SEL4_9SPHN
MNHLLRLAPALMLALSAVPAMAAPLIVVDARGGGLKPGQRIDSSRPITLKQGERVTMIGPDGKTVTLRGSFSGAPTMLASSATDPKQALAALIATRNARTSSIGVVRGATDAAPLPEPWLIDISRPGERCLEVGKQPVWWRPEAAAAQKFTILPIDQSWRADFAWAAGQHSISAPPLAKFQGQTGFVIRMDDQDYGITVDLVPADLENDFVLASWMLEKGCIQQADALLRKVEVAQASSK